MKIAENNILDRILTLTSVRALSAHQLVELLSLMVRSEEKPGGPYIFGRENDVELNTHLVRLFAQEGMILKGAAQHTRLSPDSIATPEPSHGIATQAWTKIRTSLLDLFSPHLETEINMLVASLSGADKAGEISQFSRLFATSLSVPIKATQLHIESYDLANQYAWLAYSLYDHLLDSSQSEHTLPLANHCLATSVELYSAHAENTTIIRELFSQLNTANAVELSNRNIFKYDAEQNTLNINRLPNSHTLLQLTASRSIAHIIGPLLYAQQSATSSYELDTIKEALTSYCRARQLLDDLHDWKQDIAQGQATYVIARLLEDADITIGTYAIDATIVLLEQHFFSTCLLDILDEIDAAINVAIERLLTVMPNESTPFIKSTVRPLQIASQQARKSHEFTQQFVKAYKPV